MSSITENIKLVGEEIQQLCQRYSRPFNAVQLIAVSKKHSAEAIRLAYACGLSQFGESYAQEAIEKMRLLEDLDICWHYIGPLQANKTKIIAQHFQWVHSVERIKIAQRLNDQRPPGLAPLNVCIQVNTSNEESKSGLSLRELKHTAQQIKQLDRLKLRGLMCIPAPSQDIQQQRLAFRLLAQALNQLKAAGFVDLDCLSMGMSQDYGAAIAEGSTLVRIGTGIFGARTKGL